MYSIIIIFVSDYTSPTPMDSKQEKKFVSKGVSEVSMLLSLPRSLISFLLSFLNVIDHFSATRTCKEVQDASTDPLAWSGTYHMRRADNTKRVRFLENKTAIQGLCGLNRVTNTELALLNHLPLTNLNLTYCRNITDAGLVHLISLPLTNLNLTY